MNEYEKKLFKYIESGNLSEIKKLFIEHRDKININVKTEDFNITPLYEAVKVNNLSIVNFLLTDHNIDVNTFNLYDNRIINESFAYTPLMLAISRGNTDMVRILLSHKKIDINLVSDHLKGSRRGLSHIINSRAGDINKKTEIVKLLLAHGDLNRKTIENIRDLDEMTRLDPEIGILLATLNEKRDIEDKSKNGSENKIIIEYNKQWNCLLI